MQKALRLDAQRNPTKPTIELHIEELVLYGFAPADGDRIGEAVQQELARLLTEHGLSSALSTGREIERLNAGTFQLNAQSKAEATGNEVARAVLGGLSP